MLKAYLPILDWGRRYNRQTLASDLVAAMIVTIMLIPQSLAYALLAGLPPEVGLCASVLPLVTYAIFGTSTSLAVAPVAVVSLMTATAVGRLAAEGSADYASAAVLLALLSGLMLAVMGVLRLGFVANFLSHPVISGFITASGIIIAAGQLGGILGISAKGQTLPEIVQSLASSLGDARGHTRVTYKNRYGNRMRRGLVQVLRGIKVAGSTISLVRKDGQLMARYPAPDGPVDLSGHPLFTDYLPASSQGTYESDRSPVDGVARVVSYKAVEGTSMIAIASVASSETWKNFGRSVWTVLLIVSPIVLGLGLGCWWIVVLLKRDARSAEQLTMLFREIHHRVKNNMQSVQALVRLQDIPSSAKQDLEARFSAMAAMQEQIYKHDGYASVLAKDLIPAMLEQVKAAYGSPVRLQYDIADVEIGHDQATPLALLLSELVTNALKYAFPNNRPGTISIALSEPNETGHSKLVVRDDGIGLPATEKTTSMGMRLVKGVVTQLNGRYEFRNEDGAVFEADVVLTGD